MAQILCSISFQSLFFGDYSCWLTNKYDTGRLYKSVNTENMLASCSPSAELDPDDNRSRSGECVPRLWAVSCFCVCFRKGGVGRGWLTDGQSEAFISWSVWRKHRPHLDPPVQLALVPAHNPSLWIRCQKPFPVINYFLCNLSGLRLSKSQPVHIAVCA